MIGCHVEAGRELDALIAEKVMGLTKTQFRDSRGDWDCHTRYSTSIEAALEVVEKLIEDKVVSEFGLQRWWACGLAPNNRAEYIPFESGPGSETVRVFGRSAPHTICLAALRAVGYAF